MDDTDPDGVERPRPPRETCPYGDPTCPCPDGLACHYEGPEPMPPPF